MSGTLAGLRQEAADQLNRRGIRAVTAFEAEGRKHWAGPVAAVSLSKVACVPGGFRDYLGTRRDEETGEEEELYGRAVEVTLSLDIYGPGDGGGSACREVLDRMAETLLREGAAGLTVRELESGTVEYLDRCGLYRLPVKCVCGAWLTEAVREDGGYVDILVKGRRA